jgi:spore germination protein KC
MKEHKEQMKMKRVAIILILAIFCLTASSCWSRRELNQLAIVVGLGIDKVGDQYQVSLQMVNPSEVATQGEGTGRTPVILYKEKGKTIFETIRRLTTLTPRKAFFAHLQMMVISEEVAREGVKKVLDFFWRDHEIRFDFFLVIARKRKAEDVLHVLTKLERIPSRKLYSSLETAEKYWAPVEAATMDRFVRSLLSEGITPTLTGLTVEGNPQLGAQKENIENLSRNVTLKYSGLAVFKEDRLVGWLDEMESKGRNYIHDKVNSTVGSIPCPQEKKKLLTVEIIRSDTEVIGKIESGKPAIYIDLSMETNLSEVQCSKLDVSQPDVIQQIEKAGEKKLKEILESSIYAAQKKYKADFLGFGEKIHQADPQYWNKIKKNWDKVFVKLPVHLNIDISIKHTGKASNSFIKKLEEKKKEAE